LIGKLPKTTFFYIKTFNKIKFWHILLWIDLKWKNIYTSGHFDLFLFKVKGVIYVRSSRPDQG
jgi:hypothetical protein